MVEFFNEGELALRLMFLLCFWSGLPLCSGKNQGISLAPGPEHRGSLWPENEGMKSPICFGLSPLGPERHTAALVTVLAELSLMKEFGSNCWVGCWVGLVGTSQPLCGWGLNSILIFRPTALGRRFTL